jgi:hypothetical protein
VTEHRARSSSSHHPLFYRSYLHYIHTTAFCATVLYKAYDTYLQRYDDTTVLSTIHLERESVRQNHKVVTFPLLSLLWLVCSTVSVRYLPFAYHYIELRCAASCPRTKRHYPRIASYRIHTTLLGYYSNTFTSTSTTPATATTPRIELK